MQPGSGLTGAPSANESFTADTAEVAGLFVEGKKVRALNPKYIAEWVAQDLKLSDLPMRLMGKIPAGYRLPTQAEIMGLKVQKQKQFGKMTDAVGAEDNFSYITDEGEGPARSSEWAVAGSSFREEHKGVNSTEKREPKLQVGDLIFLIQDKSPQSMAA